MAAQGPSGTLTARERMHQSEQWAVIEAHLPNPKTASAQELETQADILRARRFPEDAVDYYKYAIARGGNQAALLNKLGLTELEMRHVDLARAYFQRVVKVNAKNPDAWNNLGAVEYMDGHSGDAISDYKHAVKLRRRDPIFHANLGTAYFELKDYKSGRREIAAALKLDPRVFDNDGGGGGVSAHVLSFEDRARFAFEMAKLYARSGAEDQMLHSLGMACEAGLDIQREMLKDPVLAAFENDPRVVVIVHNAQLLRAGKSTVVGEVPALAVTQPDGGVGLAGDKTGHPESR
jgi:tetratricopeptide (TPR) repeat protein